MKIFFILLLIFPILAQARGKDKNIIMFGTGIAGFQFTVATKENKNEASMVNDMQFTPYLGYTRKPRAFWGSVPWLRGSLEFSIAPFKADRQDTSRLQDNAGKKPAGGIDLGTAVKGYLGYINPSLLLFFDVTDTIYIYGGMGLGIGFASMKGDYYQMNGPAITTACATSFRASDVMANCNKEKVDYSGVGLSVNTIIVASLGWFGMKFEHGGPGISADEKKYRAYNSMFSIFAQYRY